MGGKRKNCFILIKKTFPSLLKNLPCASPLTKMLAAAVVASAIAFSPAAMPMGVSVRTSTPVIMSEPALVRRDLLSGFAAAALAAAPLAAFADGAASTTTRLKASATQGGKIFK